MDRRRKIGFLVLFLIFGSLIGLIGASFYADYLKAQTVNDFRSSPQVGNVVEIRHPKTDRDPLMYGYFKITQVEGDIIRGQLSKYQFNSALGERLIEKPEFFNPKMIEMSRQELFDEDITNVFYHQKK